MLRNLFSRRRPSENGTEDEFDRLISRIERFAPKQHRAERDSHYYNYRMLRLYEGPLLALLTEISKHRALGENGVALTDLFERLKRFYDPRDRMPWTEALKDPALRRKFADMLSYFFGEKRAVKEDLKRFLRGMGSEYGERKEDVE